MSTWLDKYKQENPQGNSGVQANAVVQANAGGPRTWLTKYMEEHPAVSSQNAAKRNQIWQSQFSLQQSAQRQQMERQQARQRQNEAEQAASAVTAAGAVLGVSAQEQAKFVQQGVGFLKSAEKTPKTEKAETKPRGLTLDQYKHEINEAIAMGDWTEADALARSLSVEPFSDENDYAEAAAFYDDVFNRENLSNNGGIKNEAITTARYIINLADRSQWEELYLYMQSPDSATAKKAIKDAFGIDADSEKSREGNYYGLAEQLQEAINTYGYDRLSDGASEYKTMLANNVFYRRAGSTLQRAGENEASSAQMDSYVRAQTAYYILDVLSGKLGVEDNGIPTKEVLQNSTTQYLLDYLKDFCKVDLQGIDEENYRKMIRDAMAETSQKAKTMGGVLQRSGYDVEAVREYSKLVVQQGFEQERYAALEKWKDSAKWYDWVAMNALTVPFHAYVDPITSMASVTSLAGKGSDTNDPNSYTPKLGSVSGTDLVRSATSEALEKNTDWNIFGRNVASFLYNTGMSAVDSAVSALSFGNMSIFAMGTTAAGSEANNILSRGGSREQAFLGGIAAGVIEAVTEYVSVDKLLKNMGTVSSAKDWLKSVGQQMFTEGTEEMSSEVLNIIVDAVNMGNLSKNSQVVKDYMENGFSYDEARTKVLYDNVGDVIESGLSGAISGGLTAGVTSAPGAIVGQRQQNAAKRIEAAAREIRQSASQQLQQTEQRAELVQENNPDAEVVRSHGTQLYLDKNAQLEVAEKAGEVLDGILSGEITSANITGKKADKLRLFETYSAEIVSEALGVEIPKVTTAAQARAAAKNAVLAYEQRIKTVATQENNAHNSVQQSVDTSSVRNELASQAQETASEAVPAAAETQIRTEAFSETPNVVSKQQAAQELPAEQSDAPVSEANSQALGNLPYSAAQQTAGLFSGKAAGQMDYKTFKYRMKTDKEFRGRYTTRETGSLPPEARDTNAYEMYSKQMLGFQEGKERLRREEFGQRYRELNETKKNAVGDTEIDLAYQEYLENEQLNIDNAADSTYNENENGGEQNVGDRMDQGLAEGVPVRRIYDNRDAQARGNGRGHQGILRRNLSKSLSRAFNESGNGGDQNVGNRIGRGISEGSTRSRGTGVQDAEARDIGRGHQGLPRRAVSESLSKAFHESGVVAAELYSFDDDRAAFSSALDAAREADTKNGWCVTPQSAEDLSGKLTFMDEGGTIGFVLTDDGDIEGVFKNKAKNKTHFAMNGVIPLAIAAGGTKLDCYGEGLVANYERYGFIPVARVAFNEEYANPGWDASKGKPDIFFMMHNGDGAETVASKIGTYPHMSEEQLNSLPRYDKNSYDSAMAYRDELMRRSTDADSASFEGLIRQSANKKDRTYATERGAEDRVGLVENAFSEAVPQEVREAVDALAKQFGLRISYEDLGSDNGYYIPETNRVVLDINPARSAVDDAGRSAYLFTVAHEVGHYARENMSEAAWESFEAHAVTAMGGETAVSAKMQEKDAGGSSIYDTEELAREDVACDFLGQLLSDRDALQRFCEAVRSRSVSQPAARGILGAIRRVLAKLAGNKAARRSEASVQQSVAEGLELFAEDIEAGRKAASEIAEALAELAKQPRPVPTRQQAEAILAEAKNRNAAGNGDAVHYSLKDAKKIGFDQLIKQFFEKTISRANPIFISNAPKNAEAMFGTKAPFVISSSDMSKSTRENSGSSRSAHALSRNFIEHLPENIEKSVIGYLENRSGVNSFTFVCLDEETNSLVAVGGAINAIYEGQTVNRVLSIFHISAPEFFLTKSGKDLVTTDAEKAKNILEKARIQSPALQNILDSARIITQESGSVKQELSFDDEDYLLAVEAGDMDAAQEMVNEAARKAGYVNDSDWRMAHKAPNAKYDVPICQADVLYGNDGSIYSNKAAYYYGDGRSYDQKAIRVLKAVRDNPEARITVYRAVPNNRAESHVRNGDWVTITQEYAEEHGERVLNGEYRIIKNDVPAKYVYANGDSIHEYGYDDGADYAYQNTENNRKLLDAVTYDDNGRIIPLSERFNAKNPDIRRSRKDRQNETSRMPKFPTRQEADAILAEAKNRNAAGNGDVKSSKKNNTKRSATSPLSGSPATQGSVGMASKPVTAAAETLGIDTKIESNPPLSGSSGNTEGEIRTLKSKATVANSLGIGQNVSHLSDSVNRALAVFSEIVDAIERKDTALGSKKKVSPYNIEGILVREGVLNRSSGAGVSAYRKDGDHTLRLSDHSARSDNFDTAGENLSVVLLKTNKTNRFNDNDSDSADVIEVQFKKDYLDRNPEAFKNLVKDMARFVATGEYHDTAGAKNYNISGSETFRTEVMERLAEDERNRSAAAKDTVKRSRKDVPATKMDSTGKQLSESQQEYFHNSVVRDEAGNLLVVYHGTGAEFTVFDILKAGKNGRAEGYGFYFSDDQEITRRYGDRQMAVYLNITKPLYSDRKTLTKAELRKFTDAVVSKEVQSGEIGWRDSFISNYIDTYAVGVTRPAAVQRFVNEIWEMNGNDQDLIYEIANGSGQNYSAETMKDFYSVLKDSIGVDGNISTWHHADGTSNVYVAFSSEQAKNVDNANPTKNPDIRRSRKDNVLDTEEYKKPITEQDVQDLRSIGRKSINEFTAEDLKKAQKWAYKFYQELGVKSPFFRAWFGDWRANDISPAHIVSFAYGEQGKINTAARSVRSKELNTDITVDKTVIDDSVSYAKKNGDEKQIRRLLGKVDEIIKNGILLDTQVSARSSANKKGSTQFMHYLYAPVSINGAPFVAKLSVEEYDLTGKTRAYNLQRIELSEVSRAQFSQTIEGNRGKYAYTSDALSVAQLFSFVKQYDRNFKPRVCDVNRCDPIKGRKFSM